MIRLLRHSLFSKILCGSLGLYLLNISVDSADPNPQHVPEDLTFNDQESIIEFIVEQVLGYEDLIKEYDDHDSEDVNKKNNFKLTFLAPALPVAPDAPEPAVKTKKTSPTHTAWLVSAFTEVASPPPKV